MRFARLSGMAGIGFVLLLIVANVVLVSVGLPTPSDTVHIDEITAIFAAEVDALRLASALLPTAWLLATVFAAGVFAAVWSADRARADAWSLVGLAGILMQSVTFAGVEAARLALVPAAAYGPGAVAGLWSLHNALFGFNQVFLATALVGLSISGLRAGAISRWHGAVGLLGAALLFASATTSPYSGAGANPLSLLGLTGWLLWLVWIVAYSVGLMRGLQHRSAAAPTVAAP